MLGTIVALLLVLWLLGIFAFHVGSYIHLLPVPAVIATIFRPVRGSRYAN